MDEEYAKAGATLFEEHTAVFAKADLIVKVKEPQPSEYSLLKPGQILSLTCTWPRAVR